MEAFDVIRRPLVTEKGTQKMAEANEYFFEVNARANKFDIRKAVEKLFSVKVISVKTMNVHGKRKRVGGSYGKTPDWKKAIVQLKEGNKIELFESA